MHSQSAPGTSGLHIKLLQASGQSIAEMREKLKILANELDILQHESQAKDKLLQQARGHSRLL